MKLSPAFFFWHKFLLLLVLSLPLQAQQAGPILKRFNPPTYPPLARTARIQGEVRVEFIVNQDGDVVSVNLLSGHPMLAYTTTQTVSAWKFQMPKNSASNEQRLETVFSFVLNSDTSAQTSQTTDATDFRHIRIVAEDNYAIRGTNCPSGAEKQPPSTTSKDDFIEMSRSGCYGSCPAYTVRIHRSGTVEWEGEHFVSSVGRRSGKITAAAADSVIQRFRSQEFWALCSSYSVSIADGSATNFRVRVGNRSKTILNANAGPNWVEDLEEPVDAAANTHQWRHGNPISEPLVHIDEDSRMPKPGVTPLMYAAARGDKKTIKILLEHGADVRQTDTSGWNALMYATPRECGGGGDSVCISSPDVIKLLIDAGADINYSSPGGDTPLMAAAFDRRFERTLVDAGAKINAQNLQGVSVLMILASFGEKDEVQAALEAGANPRLRDHHGRTSLDYLQLANCGRSPLVGTQDEISKGKACQSLGENNVAEIRSILQKAMAP